MYTSTNLDKLQQIMAESPEHHTVISRYIANRDKAWHLLIHEIKNPLTMIYSTLQIIEADHPEVRFFRHWNTLLEDVLYTVQLLDQLSSCRNGTALHMEQVNTSNFLRRVALSFAASMAESPIDFSSQIPVSLPALMADPVQLKEVLLNLLKNAREAFPADTRSARIRMEVGLTTVRQMHSPMLQIQISDNGCGITEDQMEAIFEPFITFKPGGTGLGLPYSRQIIETHGGTLSVTSSPGTGSTFTIQLPVCLSCGTE